VFVRPSDILLTGTQCDILLARKLKVMGITQCQEKSLSVMGITQCQEISTHVTVGCPFTHALLTFLATYSTAAQQLVVHLLTPFLPS
jgi:hypothetical protein